MNGKNKEKEESEEIFNHLCYLNYAFYLSIKKDNKRFYSYCIYYITEKYNYSQHNKYSNSEKITNKVKELYQKYEDENIEYLSVEWYTPSN